MNTAIFARVKIIMRVHIPSWLDDSSLIHFARTCKFLFFSLHTPYSQAMANLKDLLDASARRNQKNSGRNIIEAS
jgi:hypothetical protein